MQINDFTSGVNKCFLQFVFRNWNLECKRVTGLQVYINLFNIYILPDVFQYQ